VCLLSDTDSYIWGVILWLVAKQVSYKVKILQIKIEFIRLFNVKLVSKRCVENARELYYELWIDHHLDELYTSRVLVCRLQYI